MPSATNLTKSKICHRLYELGCFAWIQNTSGTPDPAKGIIRPSRKVGVGDILAVLPAAPPQIITGGHFLSVEIKTGHDRARPEQIGFAKSVEYVGGHAIFVKDFEDFDTQFSKLFPNLL